MIKEIADRRSIRKYSRDEIPKELIEQVIQAGRLAPSGKNKQPWKFLIYGKDAKQELLLRMEAGIERELNGNTILPDSGYGLPDAKNTLRIMREAPVLIVVMNPYGKSPFEEITVDQRVTEIVDSLSVGAAIENMLLEAERLGLGTLWIANTCFAYPELVEYIGEPGQLIGAVALGNAEERPMPRPRKALDEIVEYRCWGLETEDLYLKKAEFQDWEALYRNVWSRPETAKFMAWRLTTSEDDAKARIQRTIEYEKNHDTWLVCEKKSGQAIGFAGVEEVKPHIFQDAGIALGPEYVGKGYGKQILRLLLQYCAALGGEEFYYSTRAENVASRALALSFGFVFQSVETKTDSRNGESYELEVYRKKMRSGQFRKNKVY